MSLCKWSCFCLLGGLLVIGWPLQVNCETPKEEASPVKAKECRQHIEKALEQYWEQKDSPEGINTDSEYFTRNLKENNYEDEKESKIRQSQNHETDLNEENSQNEDNDEDEDEDETDDVESTGEDDQEKEDDEDEESNDDNDEDNEEQSNEDTENENEENGDNDDEDDDDDESSDVDSKTQSESIETSEQNSNNNEEAGDNDDENDDDDDEDDDTNDEDDGKNDDEEEEEEEENSKLDEEEEEDDEEQNANEEELNEEEAKENENDEDENESEEATDSNAFPIEENLKKDVVVETQIKVDEAGVEEDSQKTPESIQEPEAQKEPLRTSDAQKIEETENQESGPDPSEREDDDSIENMFEEEDDEDAGSTYRSREHIDVILGLDEIGTGAEKDEEKLAQSVFRDIKKIETTNIKPMEHLYKYADSTTRLLGDAEIFSKPMLLFIGPWSTGKSSILNYILGLERTPNALKTGTGITDVDFTLLTYGAQQRTISGTELAADWHYAGVQKFGQGFLDHFRNIHIPHTLLQKVTIIDTPGIVESKKNTERGYSLNDAFQWFIDRADAIYVVLDPSKVDIGSELGSVIEQLQGRDVRFLLNKADTIRRSDLMRVVGQLFWNLSPLMSGTEAPLIYAVSLTSHPYHPSAPAKFLADQEKNFFYDMKETLEKKVENKILYARKHAVRVRNHAKMVDCYLASYYRHKSIFSSKRNVAKLITENPLDYNIYDGLSSMTNVSRHDLPNPLRYKEFFKLHPLYDFKPLSSTCSYFRGCPIDKLDIAIAKEFPELLAKYKDAKRALHEGMGKAR